jgi:quercetin dioxygenase-like cupin family protein
MAGAQLRAAAWHGRTCVRLESFPGKPIRGGRMESWDIRSLDLEPHHPQVLRSDEESRAIAIRLPPGEVLQEHQVHERAYLLVVEGEIEIANSDGEMTVGTGSLSHFGPNERRTVRALSDARLLLVLAPWPGIGHPSRVAAARAGG